MSLWKAFCQSLFCLSPKTLFDSRIALISSFLSDSSVLSSLTTDSKSPCLSSTRFSTSVISFSAPDMPAWTIVLTFSCSASFSATSACSAACFSSASLTSFAFCSACCIAILAAVDFATSSANAFKSNSASGVVFSVDICLSC